MKISRTIFFLTSLVSSQLAHAGVLYSLAGPQLVDETWNFAPPGLSLSRGATATGTLYFKYTITSPASNIANESYYAGMSFFDGTNEHLGIGNGWGAWAYSAFNTATGDTDLKSTTPEPGQPYQLVRATDTTTIVIRVDFNSGANDNVTVWFNPNFALSEAAQNPALTTTFTANADFDTIYLREGGGGAGWEFSNFVIAENATDLGFFAVPATTATWDAGGADSNWSTAVNWLDDAVPSAGFDLIFPNSANTTPTNDLTAGTGFAGLTFSAGASSYTLSGNGINLTNFIRNNSTSAQSIDLPIQLGGPLSIEALNAPIYAEGIISGSHGITKVGTNRVELTANNTYMGDTSIAAGTLSIGNGDTVGSIDPIGSITFGTGVNTRLEIFRSDAINLANNIQTAGRANIAAIGGAEVSLSGAITGAGEFWTYGPGTIKITPNAGSASFATSVVVATGVLEINDFSADTLGSGNFFIGQAGSGTLRYTGLTTSTGRIGAYALQGAGTNTFIDISSLTTELTLTQVLGENAPGKGLTKTGLGSLKLASGLTYAGDTVVEQGKLSINQSGFADSSTITVIDDAILDLNFTGADTITGLILGTDVMEPGTYNATTHPAFITGSGSLVIPFPDPFPTWISTFTFAPGADLTKGGDPDGDGMNNLLEFALDGDPSSGNSTGKLLQKIDAGYLTLTLPVRTGATFSGSGPVSASLMTDGMIYQIEGGDNLVEFASGVTELVPALAAGLPTLNAGWEYRSFRLTTPVATNGKGFLRCKITSIP